MSKRVRLAMSWLLSLGLIAATGVGQAAMAATSYSGVVLSIDQAAGRIVVGDMGPVLKNGQSEIARRRILVMPSATVVRVKRAAGVAPSGWIGDYVEDKLAATDIKPGDWVTVSVESDKQRLTATKVTVVDTSE
jgi:hypothetical protein